MGKHVHKHTGRRFGATALVVLGWVSFMLSHLFEDVAVTTLFSAIARVLP
jgi:hypothetical protein